MSVSARLPDCVVKPGLKVQRVHILFVFFIVKKFLKLLVYSLVVVDIVSPVIQIRQQVT